jgi:glycogen(starch) synthase
MKHLIISREYPPASYPPGGIGTYVMNIARLLAERGETVHIIGERWSGAPKKLEIACDGRLIVHRIGESDLPPNGGSDAARLLRELDGLKKTDFPYQWFAWHAALVAEKLIEDGAVDVVEGQEWEAPLYYLLLRRALGLGPQPSRPCIVHLHCPSVFSRHFNGALDRPRQFTLMKRMEDFCIRSADALLCPSRYLASQCREHYGLPPEWIKVIHLPVGFAPRIERKPQVWAHGSICFVGRLEPRKGIIEWFEAAIRVAREDPEVHFDFIGADILGLQRPLVKRLSHTLRPRFGFHGSKPRDELSHFLANARAAVVPSRWENFPNVCIEAMSSGLPVIATRLGGMVELVEDGRTGWLAAETGVAGMVDGLAEALRRCLAASADERASMGHAAAEAVHRICDNDRTVDEQLAFRAEVGRLGVQAARAFAGLSCRPPREGQAPGRVTERVESGSAGIVLRVGRLVDAASPLESLRMQTTPPRVIAIVSSTPPSETDAERTRRLMSDGITVLASPEHPGAEAWNVGLTASPRMGDCGFYLFLDEHDCLLPDCLERVEKTLRHRPDVGIVSFWTEADGVSASLDAPPCPLLNYQLRDNDVSPASAFRAEAIGRAPPFRAGMPRGYDIWDVANVVMADGWLAVTYPRILARRRGGKPEVIWPEATALRALRVELLRRISHTLDPGALDLIDDYVPIPLAVPEKPSATILRYLVRGLLHPRRASRAVARRLCAALASSGEG